MMKRSRLTAVALAAACANGAMAMDVAGFEFNGYSRGGPVFNHSDGIKGGLALGGDLQKFRLGNEGDNGIEINLARSFETNGVKWKVDYMPAKWSGGKIGTEQAYVEMSGFSFLPEAKFWVGQRRLRIQDVHIVDNFLMNYGDNQGAGVTDIPVGGMKLGLGVFTGDKFDNSLPDNVKAHRINADLSDIDTNPGGKLRVLLTAVGGSGQVHGDSGSGISVSHNQADFLPYCIRNATSPLKVKIAPVNSAIKLSVLINCPLTPLLTISRVPSTSVAITALPIAIASNKPIGKPSHNEGKI